MPRNVKDSEDELETKSGRKTRTMLNPSVLDSPLRRSSRIRQPMSQNDLSPEYNSDASVTSGTKSTRRRTTALDAINPEPQRNLRTRHNSATSDLSELAENDSATESIGKRITRRSIATVSSVETSSKLPPKTRRATRAGSETKSTPPVGRVTRRTRASSMEPEITDDTRIEKGDTPLKTRKRALAMPSEPAVVEESEDSRIDKTVFDTDEDESETSPNVSKSSRRKSKGDATEDEKMEVDETRELPVKETYAEDSLKELDAPEKRRSIGESGNEPEGIEKKVEANEESDGMQVFESDNESESIVCPSFKDIPADEWVDRGNKEENSKSNQDSDSVHSYSTEKNENELDVALGDKEPWQPSRKNKRDSGDKNTNDDSDDTIIAKFDRESNAFVEIGGKLVDGKRLGKDELNEEAPMDVSDNAIDEYEQEESNVSKKTPKKRSSLDSSTKHPNDNEKTSKNRSSESPLNVSRHSESNLSNKSVKRRSLNASQQKEKSSDDEYNSEMNESRKSLQSEQSSRKSLLASAKKSNTSVFNTSTSENRKSLNKPDFQSLEDSGTEEIEKKSRRSESKRNSLNNSKAEQTNVSLKNVEENESSEKLNESSKSDSKRTSMNDRRSSKNAEEVDNSSEKLNESSKSTSIKKPLENGADSDVELESSGSEIDKFDNLLQQLNESTKSKNARESLNKNTSRSQEQSSDSENEGNSDSHGKLNRSTKSMSDRRSLNKKTSKIQELSSESENEEESAGLNRSSKSTSDRKSLNNKTVSEIPEENSESGINEETTKLNRSTKSVSGRKSLNKNTSKIQEENSESENENQPAQLNRSTKSISGRKSLNNKSTSKNQGEHSESEIDEEIAELSRSTKSVSGRKSLNKNTSIIQEQSSNSEMEEETDSQTEINRSLKSMSDRKSLNLRKSLKSHEQSFESELNRSSKSTGNRKSLTTKNTSKIQEESSDSEMEEEEEVQLNQSSKSTTNRKSLSNKNSSKIQEQSSGSEIEEVQLNQSSKSTTNRKSLSNKNIPEIQEQNSGSETENENNSEVNQSAKSKKKLSTTHNGSITKPVESEKDSDSESSTNEDNSSQKLPLFLREENTCSGEEEEDSDPSIDPDIVNEMNLHGKSSLVYSDDDVPGDDCMATESESNDSEDDDGEDLKDFVVHDDEYDSEDDGDSELGDDEQESAHKIRKVKNKKRKRIIPTASSDEDSLDSEKEDEIKKSSKTFFNKDDSLEQTKTRTNKKINESLKAKNSKSPVSSSTLASEEDSENVRVTPNSGKKSKTPKKSLHKNNDSIQVLEEIINLNESVQGPLKKAHKLLSQSSTPKLSPNKKKTLEKLNSSKSSKLDNSKLEISVKSPETESNAAIDTPAKLSMSSRGTKTPKTPKSQLQMSLPIELNVSRTETILSNVKSPKLSALHQTMTTIVNDNSETRFLMKEKLNESLPASNLVQSGTGLRRSVLLELRGKMEREKAENSERNVATTIDQSIIEETVEPEAANVGKKKKKNKKKKEASVEIVENVVTLDESQEQDDTDVTSKKSKKRKKNKNQVGTMEVEETGEIEMEKGMKKKKKKQKTSQVELSKEIVHDEAVVEKKKKKQKTNVEEDIAEESEKKKKKRMKHVTIVVPEEMIEDSIKTPKKTKAQSTISTGNTKIIQSATDGSSKGLSTRIKRLPEDVLESLSQNSERPKKRRKIANENQIFPSESMFSPGGQTSQNVKVEDDYISLSSFGGTTRFESVDLSKFMKKPNKKSSTVQSFRERMLSRNPRQPISAYLMYQQKQKAAGKNKRN
ncbi:myb-like protein X isoform X2 [Venturia canescens]|uniref:myb-like protein X isoform X2 n=1 Tax=Venturia canescens TaxID=32260 RepID=UPI001C9CC3D5|nr:myb-like protein X isoform X2 [Venturia canescens]